MSTGILCIGEILWDCFPEAKFPGGAPFNTACHLHMLGENVEIASRIGEDEDGNEIFRILRKKGMAAAYLQTDATYPTGVVKVFLDAHGNPEYEIINPAAWDFIQLTKDLFKLAGESGVLVFGSLAQRNLQSRRTISELRNIIPLKVFDVNLRQPYDDMEIVKDSLAGSDIVKMNDKELERISSWFGLTGDHEETVKNISEEFNCSTICITKGEHGAALWHKKIWTEHPGYKVHVKDTVGSGDAFLASMIKDILSEKNNEEILKNANALGAYVASKNGATPEHDLTEIRKMNNS